MARPSKRKHVDEPPLQNQPLRRSKRYKQPPPGLRATNAAGAPSTNLRGKIANLLSQPVPRPLTYEDLPGEAMDEIMGYLNPLEIGDLCFASAAYKNAFQNYPLRIMKMSLTLHLGPLFVQTMDTILETSFNYIPVPPVPKGQNYFCLIRHWVRVYDALFAVGLLQLYFSDLYLNGVYLPLDTALVSINAIRLRDEFERLLLMSAQNYVYQGAPRDIQNQLLLPNVPAWDQPGANINPAVEMERVARLARERFLTLLVSPQQNHNRHANCIHRKMRLLLALLINIEVLDLLNGTGWTAVHELLEYSITNTDPRVVANLLMLAHPIRTGNRCSCLVFNFDPKVLIPNSVNPNNLNIWEMGRGTWLDRMRDRVNYAQKMRDDAKAGLLWMNEEARKYRTRLNAQGGSNAPIKKYR